MSLTARFQFIRRIHPAVATALIVLSAVLLVWRLWPIHRLVLETYAILGLLLAFRHWTPMVRWFTGMPVPHRVISLVLIGNFILGHLTLRGRTSYPFISWQIFTIPRGDDPVRCREFMATTDKGHTVRLLVEQLFPSIVQYNPPGDINSPAMTDLINAMARTYDHLHPGDPARRVDLVEVAVKLHPTSKASPTCELLKTYDVSSDRSN